MKLAAYILTVLYLPIDSQAPVNFDGCRLSRRN